MVSIINLKFLLVQKKKKVVKKTPEELLRENLVMIVNERDCAKLKKTLNENPKFDLDQPVFLEWPLLFFACHMAYTDIVRYLIEERKRDINLDVESETPLSVACYSNGVSKEVLQTVELLISKGSVVNVSNSSGVTPLMFASMKDHLVVVEYLLQKKAAIQAIDNDGRTVSRYNLVINGTGYYHLHCRHFTVQLNTIVLILQNTLLMQELIQQYAIEMDIVLSFQLK